MSSWGESIWQRGFAKGYSKAFAESFAESFEEASADWVAKAKARAEASSLKLGKAKGIASSIANLMETMSLDREQAMDALKIPLEERAGYAKLLQRPIELAESKEER